MYYTGHSHMKVKIYWDCIKFIDVYSINILYKISSCVIIFEVTKVNILFYFGTLEEIFGPLSNGLLLVRKNASFKDTVITDISSPDANSPFFFSQYMSGTRSPRDSKTNFLKEKNVFWLKSCWRENKYF